MIEHFKLSTEKFEFFPLGGFILTVEECEFRRNLIRETLGLNEHDLLFIHAGKLEPKKRTADLLKAFSSVPDEQFHLLIIGSLPSQVRPKVGQLMAQDKRIHFLGWKSADELTSYLCACDLYLQPGYPSAIMQTAAACGAPLMLHPFQDYQELAQGNTFFVETVTDMTHVFRSLADCPEQLQQMRYASRQVAEKYFDYRRMAARLYV
jgi:glycosyltransferase involved in cell wall biosynthesis